MGQNFSTASNSHDPTQSDMDDASSSSSSSGTRRSTSRMSRNAASARQSNRFNPLSQSARVTRSSSSSSLPLDPANRMGGDDPMPPSMGMLTRSRAAARQRMRDANLTDVTPLPADSPYGLRRSTRMARMQEQHQLLQQQQQQQTAIDAAATATTAMMDTDNDASSTAATDGSAATANGTILAPSMIADVITQAVLSAFRERHANVEQQDGDAAMTDSTALNPSDPVAAAPPAPAASTPPAGGEGISQGEQISALASVHFPSVMTQQQSSSSSSPSNTGASNDESFFRYVRLPVMLTTLSANGETQQQREIAMPMVIVGYRIRGTSTEDEQQQATVGGQQEQQQEQEPAEGLRRSQRLAEQRQQRQQQQQQQQQNASSRWMVWIYSDTTGGEMGGSLGGGLPGLGESPSYEELLSLVESLGPARFPISIEQIDASAPTQRYNVQVAGSMVGNREQCLVCLENFQETEMVRVLKCQHGFHQACIDKWLTEGQNRCPLCRAIPVERTPNNTSTNTTTATAAL